MKPYIRTLLIGGALFFLAPSLLPAQGPGRCGEPDLRLRPRNFLIIDANTAAPVEGRARFRYGERMMVIIRNMNPFRYTYRTGNSTMPLAGAIHSDLLIPIGGEADGYRGPGATVPSRQIAACSDADRKGGSVVLSRIDQATKEIDADLESLRKRIADAIKGHDNFLRLVSGEKVYCEKALYEARRMTTLLDELANPAALITELERVGDRVNGLGRLYDLLLDSMAQRPRSCREDVLALQQTETARMRSNVGTVLSLIKAIVSRRQSFLDLAAIVASVNENSFTDVIEPFVPEGATSITVEVFRRDLMVKNASEVKIGEVRIDIDRPAPVSLSAGLGLSTVRDTRLGIVDGRIPGTTDSLGAVFGYERNVVGMPNLIALLNVHFHRWTAGESFDLSLALSAGTVLESDLFEGNPAYILGGTFGMLDDRLLTTIGIHWRRQEVLTGGFAVGDPVPDGLRTIPTERDYSAGFIFGVSGRIR